MVRYNHILSSHVRCGHGDNEGDDGDEAGIFLEQKSKFRGLREMVLRQSGDSWRWFQWFKNRYQALYSAAYECIFVFSASVWRKYYVHVVD